MIPACIGFEDVFSATEMRAMDTLSRLLKHRPATTEDADAGHRAGKVAWYDPARLGESSMSERIDTVMREVNEAHFHFDLAGPTDLQFARYGVGDHFGWHMDMRKEGAPRKLALVIGLSESGDYEGGMLEVQGGNHTPSFHMKAGMMVALPAWTLHRVTPVTSGVRRTLVAWATGPQYR